ncbi:MAG: alpha amylase C-terminal domain-containing protein [Candidatus Sacchiramonaceae bacterium]|nr:alpha amylase C-terminal domain-containing protein [Candidatus Saccharimonadaceae bacterium]
MAAKLKILDIDPYLEPHKDDLILRANNLKSAKKRLLKNHENLASFANGHLYFGFHKQKDGWIFREWAPAAKEIALIGDFNNWNRNSHKLENIGDGVWEIHIPESDKLEYKSKIKLEITTAREKFDRIPTYIKRVIQKENSIDFDGQVWAPDESFNWTDSGFKLNSNEPPMIYEAHIGMSSSEEKISSFNEFTKNVLPRIKKLGYNTVQLMAIAEHPYYGSFGYQVSNFFAVSSRFGMPEDLKSLINTAHKMGIAVLLDLVHSHAAANTAEGLARFDGTEYQFFHKGKKGTHPAWGSKLFNYGKPEVVHFLLSNIKYWLEEYHFDGFRFDGVTSMLYHNHGLGMTFDNYKKYFSLNTDTEAVTYLQLATETAKEVKPDCILISEDMSGMPGMALSVKDGGIGFNYRLGMGIPDFWIKLLKKNSELDWNLGEIWHELIQRRTGEKVIGYAESHDQALVGDKTIMFRLADAAMYWEMDTNSNNHAIERAIALHKMIRLITCTTAGDGYLNFMGNEFGHPEWIDFPREGNNWSYSHARRRWDLADDKNLRYQYLQNFDQAMVELVRENNLLNTEMKQLWHDEQAKVLVYQRGNYVLMFNFHPHDSFETELQFNSNTIGELTLHSDWAKFGGHSGTARKVKTNCDSDGKFRVVIRPHTAMIYKMDF